MRDWLKSHPTHARLGLILAVSICLRITTFNGHGFGGGDDAAYADLAYSLVAGDFHRARETAAPIYPARVGVIVPAAVAFKLFGVSEAALAVYPLLVSLVGVIVAFLAGRMIFNESAGLIAALLVALLPVDVRYATLLYPDPPAVLLSNVAILLLYSGFRWPGARTKVAYGALAGLCLGFSWLCKEAVLFSLPLIAAYLLWSVYRDRSNVVLSVGLAVGCTAVLVVECAAYAAYLSDALYHFHTLERHNRHPLATPWFWQADAPWSALLARLFRDGPQTILLNTQFGLVTLVATLAVLYAVFKNMASYGFVGAWFGYHVALLNFGSHSLRHYMPLPTYDRYQWSLLLPAVLLTAAFLDHLLRPRNTQGERKESDSVFWAGVLAGVLAIGSVHGVYRNMKEESPFQAEKAVARLVSPDAAVFSDPISLSRLRFFWAYPRDVRLVNFGGMQTVDVSRNAYVLLNPKRAEVLVQLGWRPPEFLSGSVKPSWIAKWEGAGARLYWVAD